MQKHEATTKRALRIDRREADLIVVGGGMAGLCCAITAARAGTKTVLVQDRPLLGGNASSEVRLWILGATSHMGNNNRWSREGGVIDEILVENTYRNPEGNPVIFDALLLEKASGEENLSLLLNTAVHDLAVDDGGAIESVTAFCSQNSTQYVLRAPLYCDASGDGILGFLAGAAFRIGAESHLEFGELLAPPEPRNELLGQSIYFYTRDTGRPVRFVPPKFALSDITKIPRYRRFNAKEYGCQLWWIEHGGRRDTVTDTEEIKWELWKIVYGIWNHLKNSGEFPETETMTLEWVGMIPGKRESRRFEGDYMLTQQDVVEQRVHYDAVSYGGWAIDLHPPDGIYSPDEPCVQWHSKGVYQIPYRTMYSRNVPNLFLTGRIISASHIAFGSTRVMATCAHNGQAVGMAANLCRVQRCRPRDLAHPAWIGALQQALLRTAHYIPGVRRNGPDDLAQSATAQASSELELAELPSNGRWRLLDDSQAIVLPIAAGRMPRVTIEVRPRRDTTLVAELRTSSRPGNFAPDVVLERLEIPLDVALNSPAEDDGAAKDFGVNGDGSGAERHYGGVLRTDEAVAVVIKKPLAHEAVTPLLPVTAVSRSIELAFRHDFPKGTYAFVCLIANPDVEIALSDHRVTGLVTVFHQRNPRVAKGAVQAPPLGIGVEHCEFWTPKRRPGGENLAIRIDPPLAVFEAPNVINGFGRPTTGPNAWIAALDDRQPTLRLQWDEARVIERVELVFDTDFDHAMENVLMTHPETVMPFCVRNVRLRGCGGQLLAEVTENHQTLVACRLSPAVRTTELTVELETPTANTPASLFEVRCYGPESEAN